MRRVEHGYSYTRRREHRKHAIRILKRGETEETGIDQVNGEVNDEVGLHE